MIRPPFPFSGLPSLGWFRALTGLLGRRETRRAAARMAAHVFRKHPSRHADKAVQAAFKVGVATARRVARG